MSASGCSKEEGVVPTMHTPELVVPNYSVNKQGAAATWQRLCWHWRYEKGKYPSSHHPSLVSCLGPHLHGYFYILWEMSCPVYFIRHETHTVKRPDGFWRFAACSLEGTMDKWQNPKSKTNCLGSKNPKWNWLRVLAGWEEASSAGGECHYTAQIYCPECARAPGMFVCAWHWGKCIRVLLGQQAPPNSVQRRWCSDVFGGKLGNIHQSFKRMSLLWPNKLDSGK